MRIVITKTGVITKLEFWTGMGDGFKTLEFQTTESVTIDDFRQSDANGNLREALRETARTTSRRARPDRSPGRCTECGIWATKDNIGAWVVLHAETCSLHESNRSD